MAHVQKAGLLALSRCATAGQNRSTSCMSPQVHSLPGMASWQPKGTMHGVARRHAEEQSLTCSRATIACISVLLAPCWHAGARPGRACLGALPPAVEESKLECFMRPHGETALSCLVDTPTIAVACTLPGLDQYVHTDAKATPIWLLSLCLAATAVSTTC